MVTQSNSEASKKDYEIPCDKTFLPGTLTIPSNAESVVIFAHGSGSGRLSVRNQYVAKVLQNAGLATFQFDLLNETEALDQQKVFDIDLLANRLEVVSKWLNHQPETCSFSMGCFGSSTGGGAALVAAARNPSLISAVVSRGGRPDLAGDDLDFVIVPTLLIVGENDASVIALNRMAFEKLHCEKKMVIVRGATHLFPEPGALEEVAILARDWFVNHLAAIKINLK
ncbi:MAG: alpha/beta hydrolase [Planctomycetes bacterium]|nr:alpha/beta hydrolase [Planctomycetota bacterium]